MSSMFDAEQMVNAVKIAALDAVESTYPVRIAFGTVEGIDPLRVRLSPQLTLTEGFLMLTASVTEHKLETDIPGITLTVKNGLKVGERVLLMRMQGGQRYIILDRMVD